MSLDWLLAFCAWMPLPFIAWFARRVQGGWLAPGAVAALTWTIGAGLPLWLAPDLPVHPGAYGLVLLAVAVCVVASTIGSSIVLKQAVDRAPAGPRAWKTTTWQFYYACIAIGCAAPVMLYGDASRHTGATNLSDLAMYTSMGRYEGDYSIPLAVRLLTASIFLAATVSAFMTASSPSAERRWLRSLAWLVPLVGNVVVHTAKADLLYGLVLWGGGWAAGSAFYNSPAKSRPGRTALIVSAGIVAAATIFVGAQAMRMNRVSIMDIPYVLGHLRIYVVGHMPVFGDWLVNGMPRMAGDGLGSNTFAGIAELMGLVQRKSGLYEGTSGFTESNIYTALRPLLEDFGVIGGLVFLFLLALGAGIGWRLLQSGRIVGAGIVVPFVGYVLWSPITSLFVYSTLIAVELMFATWAFWADETMHRQERVRCSAPRQRTVEMS